MIILNLTLLDFLFFIFLLFFYVLLYWFFRMLPYYYLNPFFPPSIYFTHIKYFVNKNSLNLVFLFIDNDFGVASNKQLLLATSTLILIRLHLRLNSLKHNCRIGLQITQVLSFICYNKSFAESLVLCDLSP